MGKALTTKCVFQNYSQLSDNIKWLFLKTANQETSCAKCISAARKSKAFRPAL